MLGTPAQRSQGKQANVSRPDIPQSAEGKPAEHQQITFDEGAAATRETLDLKLALLHQDHGPSPFCSVRRPPLADRQLDTPALEACGQLGALEKLEQPVGLAHGRPTQAAAGMFWLRRKTFSGS